MLEKGENKDISVIKGLLSFRDLGYKVQVAGRCCRGKVSKCILKNISGSFGPGLNAILGPTGSGKTSLLDVLAGRCDSESVEGVVLLNGRPLPENFHCASGYVIQEDIVMGMLTVRENISFAASLKLPQHTSDNVRKERVNQVIGELGLTACAETRVGTELRRGLSGGEIRRTSIAMELVTSPSVLFLDEPTTGLDAHAALTLISLLKQLSHGGRTVIFAIHQPRYAIFRLFDSLLLVNAGQLIYHGPASDALSYFHSIGYECEQHNNPADFFVDVISGTLQRQHANSSGNSDSMKVSCGDSEPSSEFVININGDKVTSKIACEKSEETEEHVQLMVEPSADSTALSSTHNLLVTSFVNSVQYKKISEVHSDVDKAASQPRFKTFPFRTVSYQTSYCQQLRLVSQRTARSAFRHPHAISMQACSAIILGLIVGCIYFQVGDSPASAIQNRVGAFFFIVMNHVFGNMAVVDLFIRDRAVFIHENVSGYYSVSVYFLSKLMFDVLPTRLVSVVLFSSIAYWMIGLQPVLWQFMFFTCNLLMTSVSATSVALLLSASVSVHAVGTILTALIWVFMMVFSGLLVNIETVPVFLRWMQWLSIFRYSMNALQVCELKDAVFCGESAFNSTEVAGCVYGNLYLTEQGIEHESMWDLCVNEVALLVIGVCFLLLAYISLRRMKKSK